MEDADDHITLRRAADIAGLSPETLRSQARAGKMRSTKLGRVHLTTRRWLHEYLTAADERDRGTRKPLPADYIAPDCPVRAYPSFEVTLITKAAANPVGSMKYVSTPQLFLHIAPGHRQNVTAPLAETFGATPQQATAKLKAYMDKWIADHPTPDGTSEGPG